MTESRAAMKGWIARALCAVPARSCFSAKRGAYARLSMRETFHLVLSLSKGEVGTASKADTEVFHSAPCCEAA